MNCKIFLTLFLVIVSCSRSPDNPPKNTKADFETKVPSYIDSLENLKVYPTNRQTPDTVELVREQVFESNEDIYIEGYISDLAVDYRNRVYIVGFKPGATGIYIFKSDGSFEKKIGKYGKGPGEFLTIGGITIGEDQLYIYDAHQKKMTGFSLENFSVAYEEILNENNVKKENQLTFMSPTGNFFFSQKGTFFLEFKSNNRITENRKINYYELTNEASIVPGSLLELRGHHIYQTGMKRIGEGSVLPPFTMPFNRSSLITFSNSENTFYTAWTEDFLIKKYDDKGHYKSAFYYPIEKSPISLSHMNINKYRMKFLEDEKIPETWPALHNMVADDQQRLWIFTITESESTFKGWVLNSKGETLAKFDWPGKRTTRSVKSKPLFVIKNGYLYTLRRNIDAGINQIVKYKINFKER